MTGVFDGCPEGVGALFASDPLRSSGSIRSYVIRYTACVGFTAGSRQIVSKPSAYTFGRIKKTFITRAPIPATFGKIKSKPHLSSIGMLPRIFHLSRSERRNAGP